MNIMPHVIHKFLYQDALEDAEQVGLHVCVRCGLCSFVCPSKLDLVMQFTEAQITLELEKESIPEEEVVS